MYYLDMKKQNGFSTVEGLIVVIVLAMVGFGGYYVWSQNRNNDVKQADSSQQAGNTQSTETAKEVPQETEDPLSKDWERYESGMGAFSIKLADGLDGAKDTTSDVFFFRDYLNKDQPATVQEINGSGTDGFMALYISQNETAEIWSPAETEMESLLEEPFTTSSEVKGIKKSYNYPYLPPCEGPGCLLGEKNVVYEFANGSNTIRIWYSRLVANDETKRVYDITEDSPDFTAEVDAMVRSLVIN